MSQNGRSYLEGSLRGSVGAYLGARISLSERFLFLVSFLCFRVGGLKNTENVEVILFKEDSLPLKVVIYKLLLLLDGFGFAVNLLENDLEEVHLTLG